MGRPRPASLGHPQPDPCEGVAANGRRRESVWEYPRPPKLEVVERRVRVQLGGETIADVARRGAKRVCETAGGPVVYLPPGEIAEGALTPVPGGSFCEWKGQASYFDVSAGGQTARRGAWTYTDPNAAYRELRDLVAFYPGLLECHLDDERVEPQPGGFYGGWITAEICGPIKGEPGSGGW